MKKTLGNIWITITSIIFCNLASVNAFALDDSWDGVPELVVTGENSTTLPANTRGNAPGGPSIVDARGAANAIRQKEKAKKDCKDAAASQLQTCNKSAVSSHRWSSGYCSGAKWISAGLGVAGGWAYSEGEGAGAFLLAGSGAALYQWGDDCQRDMDRVFNAAVAQCSVNQIKEENRCDAL